jgi:hypothetical protein
MTNEEKRQILELIKRHIDEHDTVRVGWAAEQILKSKQQNHVLDKLSAAVTKTNKYIREPANPNFSYDWNVRKNPLYRYQLLHDIKIVLLSSILTLAVGLILWLIDKKSQDQQLNLLKERLRKVETILNNQPSDSTKQ